MNIRLMQLIGLRKLLPKSFRAPLRVHWNRLLGWEQYARERSFYRRLIRKGDLVFDVGANVGGKAAAFLSLGARVVAVEPNSNCTGYLLRKYRHAIQGERLHVECAAVASTNGELSLTVVDPDSAMCSGEPDFLEYARTIGYKGVQAITARSITLDCLIERYGLPDFIKVDVEGMDADVLKGLSQRPRSLSFEYHTAAALWPKTRECFNQVLRLGFTEANLTEMTVPKFIFDSWIGINAALSELEKWRESGNHWGDVVVR
jgi:FkbM family methyltransferase